MAIAGLTDRSPSFKEIGRLRKGAPKGEGLKNLTYFRPDFRPDEVAAYDAFLNAYGQQPTRINIRLAFPQLDRCWDTFFAVYNGAGLLGKAESVPGRDGNHWTYLRDNKTGEILVKDGVAARPGFNTAFDPSVPVYSYRNKKNQDVPVYAKPEGRLYVLIPELQVVGYVTVLTHSYYDIMRIDSQLKGVQEMVERIGLTLPLVPLVLTRRPEQVSVTVGGKKSMREEWLINLHVREDWGAAQFALLDRITPGVALPAPAVAAPLELPAGIHHDDAWTDDEDPDMPSEPAETAFQPAQPPAANGNGKPKTNSEKVAEQQAAVAGQPPAPEPPAEQPSPMQAVLGALDRKTSKGTLFRAMTREQLEQITTLAQASPESKAAATLLLSKPTGPMWEAWAALCEQADAQHIPEIVEVPQNANCQDLGKLYLELAQKLEGILN